MQRLGFHLARATLKHPIAALVSGPCCVVRGSHIGLSEAGQLAKQRRALCALAGIAAINQDIAIGCQCCANGIQLFGVLADVLVVQPDIAQFDRAFCTVAQEVYGIDVGTIFQVVGDLLQTVFAAVENHDLCTAR